MEAIDGDGDLLRLPWRDALEADAELDPMHCQPGPALRAPVEPNELWQMSTSNGHFALAHGPLNIALTVLERLLAASTCALA